MLKGRGGGKLGGGGVLAVGRPALCLFSHLSELMHVRLIAWQVLTIQSLVLNVHTFNGMAARLHEIYKYCCKLLT